MNKNLELMVFGRPDRGLNYDLILDAFNAKPVDDKMSFINVVISLLDLNDFNKVETTVLHISELLLDFLEISYKKNNNKIEVEAISRNDLNANKLDTYLLNIDAQKLVESFASSKNTLLVKDDKLGDKVFEALYRPQGQEKKSIVV